MWTNKSLSELTSFTRSAFVQISATHNLGSNSKPKIYTDDEANLMLALMGFEVESFVSLSKNSDELNVEFEGNVNKKYFSLKQAALKTGMSISTWKSWIDKKNLDCLFVQRWYVSDIEVEREILKRKKANELIAGDDDGEGYICLKQAEEISGISSAAWWARINRGIIEGINLDGVWYVPKDQIIEKIEGKTYGYTTLARVFDKKPGTIRHFERRGLIEHKIGPDGPYFTESDREIISKYYQNRRANSSLFRVNYNLCTLLDERKAQAKEEKRLAAEKRKAEVQERKRIAAQKKIERDNRKKLTKTKPKTTVKRNYQPKTNLPKVEDVEYEAKLKFPYLLTVRDAIENGEVCDEFEQFESDIERMCNMYSLSGDDEAWGHARDALCITLSDIYSFYEHREALNESSKHHLCLFLKLVHKYANDDWD